MPAGLSPKQVQVLLQGGPRRWRRLAAAGGMLSFLTFLSFISEQLTLLEKVLCLHARGNLLLVGCPASSAAAPFPSSLSSDDNPTPSHTNDNNGRLALYSLSDLSRPPTHLTHLRLPAAADVREIAATRKAAGWLHAIACGGGDGDGDAAADRFVAIKLVPLADTGGGGEGGCWWSRRRRRGASRHHASLDDGAAVRRGAVRGWGAVHEGRGAGPTATGATGVVELSVLCGFQDGNLRGWTVQVGRSSTSSSTSFGYDGGGTGALSFTAAQTELLSFLGDWIHCVDAGFDGVGLQGPHHRRLRRMRCWRVWLWDRRAVLRRSGLAAAAAVVVVGG
ncbi:hypothetical protein DFJ73DRAFT_803045 [Zopfochytrium polystomum]|nr:hypothetical protein DFJ73DRAFT_803045 [Zopfochytrium polystomum]